MRVRPSATGKVTGKKPEPKAAGVPVPYTDLLSYPKGRTIKYKEKRGEHEVTINIAPCNGLGGLAEMACHVRHFYSLIESQMDGPPLSLFYSLFEQTLVDGARQKWRVFWNTIEYGTDLDPQAHLKEFISFGYGLEGARHEQVEYV